MGLAEFITITIGLLIAAYAVVAFLYRLVKGEPLWPNLKKMIVGVIDGISGMG